jgi:hypothetical protein
MVHWTYRDRHSDDQVGGACGWLGVVMLEIRLTLTDGNKTVHIPCGAIQISGTLLKNDEHVIARQVRDAVERYIVDA